MPHWSREQDAILAACANLGAERAAAIIRYETGQPHTVYAVRKRASRLGITLTVYEVCPRCGGKVRELTADGICYECNTREKAGAAMAEAAKIRRELDAAELVGDNVRREYTRARVQLHRARKG